MSGELSVLATAIEDAGAWRWWTSSLPSAVQLEFIGVQLARARDGGPALPLGVVALRFETPSAIAFVRSADSEYGSAWQDEFRNERIPPLAISYEHFTFDDIAASEAILKDPNLVDWLLQPSDLPFTLRTAPKQLAFWTGSVGLFVSAAKVHVVGQDGDIPLSAIPALHDAWWKYWTDYWQRRGTPEALPYDGTCEVVIPLKQS